MDRAGTFTKTRSASPVDFFVREAAGLTTLRESGTVRVPRVLSVGPGHLGVERVETGSPREHTEEALGRELAALHACHGSAFGSVDGDPSAYLGEVAIDLTRCSTWAESCGRRRILPLAERAAREGVLDPMAVPLAGELAADPERWGPAEPPSLLHGDLWAGNRLVDHNGDSWLIDPSAQYGHRETDLAMMQLFGGFGETVFAAYAEVSPPADGWQERVGLHQLVPLLVHALMFGGGYGERVLGELRRGTR